MADGEPRSVKHGLGAWFGSGPRRHGEPVEGRSVSYLELFYDLVFVVLVGQAAHSLAAHPGWRGTAAFAVVFGLVWIAWINGTLYHELHGREDGRSRAYVFAQMGVLAVLAVFTGYAGGGDDSDDGTAFALTYAVLLVLLSWQWYEVRRRDLPEHRPASTPYLLGLLATIAVMVASAWLAPVPRLAAWAVVVTGWVVLGILGFVGRSRPLTFFRATESLVERMALFIIIVLGETVVGVVNGIAETERDALTIATGVLGLVIGFGIWWNYFDVVGVREPREERRALATWFFGHLPQAGAIAVTGAAMVGLVENAHEPRTPPAVAWTLAGAVALILVLIAAQSAAVVQRVGLDARLRARIYVVGAVLVLVLGAGRPGALAAGAARRRRAQPHVALVVRPDRLTGQGLAASTRNAARMARCTLPWSRVARPGTTVSAPTSMVSAKSTSWVDPRPRSSGPLEPDGRDRDRRDRQADAGHRRPEREVDRHLRAVAAGRAVRRERLGEQHQQRDHDADDRLRQAGARHRVLDERRLHLREPDDDDEREQQQRQARQRGATARRLGVLVAVGIVVDVDGEEEVAVPHGLGDHEDAVDHRRGDGRERRAARR